MAEMWSCFLAMACLFLAFRAAMVESAKADLSSCNTALQALLPCLTYAQGKAAVPTASCCTNLESVHENNPACLCELIVSSIDHNSQLPPINTTLSLQLGPACNVKTQPRRCPDLLGISPSSAEGKIFETGSPLASPAGGPISPPSSTATQSPTQPQSGASALSFPYASVSIAIVSALAVFLHY